MLVKGAERSEADEVVCLRIGLILRCCMLTPHPSTALTPSPEGEGFIQNLNAYYRRGELRSPEFYDNNATTNGANTVRPYGYLIYKSKTKEKTTHFSRIF